MQVAYRSGPLKPSPIIIIKELGKYALRRIKSYDLESRLFHFLIIIRTTLDNIVDYLLFFLLVFIFC